MAFSPFLLRQESGCCFGSLKEYGGRGNDKRVRRKKKNLRKLQNQSVLYWSSSMYLIQYFFDSLCRMYIRSHRNAPWACCSPSKYDFTFSLFYVFGKLI